MVGGGGGGGGGAPGGAPAGQTGVRPTRSAVSTVHRSLVMLQTLVVAGLGLVHTAQHRALEQGRRPGAARSEARINIHRELSVWLAGCGAADGVLP